jgi:hypothetical protein
MAGNANFAAFIAKKKGDKNAKGDKSKGKNGPADEVRSKKLKEMAAKNG